MRHHVEQMVPLLGLAQGLACEKVTRLKGCTCIYLSHQVCEQWPHCSHFMPALASKGSRRCQERTPHPPTTQAHSHTYTHANTHAHANTHTGTHVRNSATAVGNLVLARERGLPSDVATLMLAAGAACSPCVGVGVGVCVWVCVRV